MKATRTCTVDSCERSQVARSLCALHYQRWMRLGTVDLPPQRVCEVPECQRPHLARGWCRKHYRQLRETSCSIEDCGGVVVGRGYCGKHYERLRRLGVTELRPQLDRGCQILDCSRPHDAMGFCNMHWQRWRRHGNPNHVEPLVFELWGSDHPNWRADDVGYSSLHGRVRRRRGPAGDYPCRHCGGSADEWAYDHTDPAEITDIQSGLPYSTDLAFYIPLCVSCHRKFDIHVPPLT